MTGSIYGRDEEHAHRVFFDFMGTPPTWWGVTVGILYGAGFGRMGGLMGILDGAGMGGFMGGMMGAMLGVMINVSTIAVWVSAAFVTVIGLALLAGLIRYIQQTSDKQYARDPVCDMDVDVATARFISSYHGQAVYFCAPGCKFTFDEKPEDYVGPNRKPYMPMSDHGGKM